MTRIPLRKGPKRFFLTLGMLAFTAGCMVAPYTKYMASEVRIRIVKSGKAVSGAVVTREIAVQGGSDHEAQQATTDLDGVATLPAITRIGIVQSIATVVVAHKWTLAIDGKSSVIWEGSKASPSPTAGGEGPADLFNVFGGDITYVFDIDHPGSKARPYRQTPQKTNSPLGK